MAFHLAAGGSFPIGRAFGLRWETVGAVYMRSDRTALVRSVWIHNVYEMGLVTDLQGRYRSTITELAGTVAIPNCEGLHCRLSSWIRRLRVRLDGKKGECVGNALLF